jgi:hexosaminidase
MKNIFLLGIILICSFELIAQSRYPIIPYPNKLVEAEGEFEFKGKLSTNFDVLLKTEKETIGKIFEEEYFTRLVPSQNGDLVVRRNSSLRKEAYKLTVTKDKILVEASNGTGCFYAFQTIRQLMKLIGTGAYQVPACQIEDQPAFSWRAYMLDEARNFQGKVVVKNLLDQMALLKMNVFHWHLTDDQGWRIEIKKYPLLTEVGAWRDSTKSRKLLFFDKKWNWINDKKFNSDAHGGYYSQEDIQEVVAYATKRHITIVPEIEMPGHAMAAIAAYPWLLSSDEQIKVPTTYGIKDLAYNIANPKVYMFLEDVLKEIMQLFPGKVIHIGGDEVKYDSWKSSRDIKELMKKENLKTYADMQIYFTNRISNFIEKNGYRMMGWNEIMGNVHVAQNELTNNKTLGEAELNAKSKLASNSIIHFWKGDSLLLIDALNKGYAVVNSTSIYTYLDYPIERTSISKAYHFSPIPNGISNEQASHILGLGCQMWGEVTPRVIDVFQYTFPRIAAYAEVGWTNEQNKDFDRFTIALVKMKKFWDKKGIYYLEE